MTERSEAAANRERLREFRRIVANAVGELRSQEVRDSYAALSIEELMDQHIERLEGTNDPNQPSRIQRLRNVRDALTDNIEAMKETPPAAFRRPDPDNDVNTEPEAG